MNFPPSQNRRGFSLVEIVIALGIISFALVAMMGMLGVFFNVSKSATDDTLLAAMSRQITTDMRSIPFADIQAQFVGASIYFNAEGSRFNSDGTPVGQGDAFYECRVRTSTPNPIELTTLLPFTMTFTWPVGSSSPNEYIVPASIANYNPPAQ